MEEIWKEVVGFEGSYKVSNLGRVFSYKKVSRKEHFMKPCNDGNGYMIVCLRKQGKKYIKKVHRLVAEAFIPNPQNLPQVNHKDENKANNCVENLEWCSSRYNINYGTAIKRRIQTIANNGGRVQTEETKEKLRNRVFSEETRQKIREKAIGRSVSRETREKISRSQKGQKHWWSKTNNSKTNPELEKFKKRRK